VIRALNFRRKSSHQQAQLLEGDRLEQDVVPEVWTDRDRHVDSARPEYTCVSFGQFRRRDLQDAELCVLRKGFARVSSASDILAAFTGTMSEPERDLKG
jgi:hypothetical protein